MSNEVRDLFSSLDDCINKIVEGIEAEPENDDGLDSLSKNVIIRPHDKPDPDAISSSIALSKEFKKKDVDSYILFHRESPFYENQAMHNMLDLKATSKIVRMTNLMKGLSHREFEELISSNKFSVLVDTSSISSSSPDYGILKPSLVVDHHNGNHSTYSSAVKIAPEVGANISFLLSYLIRDGYSISSKENQALRISSYVGIETDTSGFMKELMTDLDYEMKALLEENLTSEDYSLIEKIKSPELDRDIKRSYGKALQNHETHLDDKLTVYCIPEILKDSAIVPYITDRFFRQDKLGKAVIVFGISDTTEDDIRYLELNASGRSIDPGINMPDLFEEVFYSKMHDGKRQNCSGGSSYAQTGMSRAGATIPLKEYEEHSFDDLQDIWMIESKKYLARLKTKLSIKEK